MAKKTSPETTAQLPSVAASSGRPSVAAASGPVLSTDHLAETGGRAEAGAGAYVVLARKYRPAAFNDLIGQAAMVTTLANAFASGRIAQAYMLTGVRGVGKTTTARILARALNYSRDGAADAPSTDMPELGRHCQEIIESRHPDVIEMDAASNTGVDNIREIIENARYRPLVARYKVFIVDEVHMLSKGAFNALLKTLEEPPEHVRFIFATTEIRKVPVTVLSRCQRFDLRRIDVPLLVEHLASIVRREGAMATDDALVLIAHAAGGSVRDGLSLLDQAIAMGRGSVSADDIRAMLGLADRGRIFDLLDMVFGGQPAAALTAFSALHRDGAEPGQIVADLSETVHIVTRTKVVGRQGADHVMSAEEQRRAEHLARQLSLPILARAFQILTKGLEETVRAGHPLAAAEMVLIRLCHMSDLPTPDEIIRAIGGLGTAPKSPQSAPSATRAHADATAALPVAGLPGSKAALVAPDDDDEAVSEDLGLDVRDVTTPSVADDAVPPLSTFADVVAFVGARRDAKLMVHLEEHVSLVRFDAVARSIDICLLPGALPEIANDLREKLMRWTGERWVVMLSNSAGQPPIGDVRRAREAADLERLKSHPAVAAVLETFPEARIAKVTPLRKGAQQK